MPVILIWYTQKYEFIHILPFLSNLINRSSLQFYSDIDTKGWYSFSPPPKKKKREKFGPKNRLRSLNQYPILETRI